MSRFETGPHEYEAKMPRGMSRRLVKILQLLRCLGHKSSIFEVSRTRPVGRDFGTLQSRHNLPPETSITVLCYSTQEPVCYEGLTDKLWA
jgi:hypothetical protein